VCPHGGTRAGFASLEEFHDAFDPGADVHGIPPAGEEAVGGVEGDEVEVVLHP